MAIPIASTVLIVDDDPVIAMMYRLGLEAAGYRVLAAKNGRDGLELAATAHPDLILLDVRMPVMDGIEVLKRLSADAATQQIPVVMLSNFGEPAVVEQALALGAKEYLVKIDTVPAGLAAVVARWLDARSLG